MLYGHTIILKDYNCDIFQTLEEFHNGLVEYDREEAFNQLIQDFKLSSSSQ